MEGLFKSDSAVIQVLGLAVVSERASPQSELTRVRGSALAPYWLASFVGAHPREFCRQARSVAADCSRSQAFSSVPVSERATSRFGKEGRQCRRHITSQWSGRLRAAHSGAAHRRVICQRVEVRARVAFGLCGSALKVLSSVSPSARVLSSGKFVQVGQRRNPGVWFRGGQ